MGKFVRNITVSKPFQGETAVIVLRPINQADALKLFNQSDNPGAISELMKLLPPYVVSFSGLTASDDTPISMDDLLGAAYFTGLLGEVAGEWIAKSLPGN
jgi:hypothetical protein